MARKDDRGLIARTYWPSMADEIYKENPTGLFMSEWI